MKYYILKNKKLLICISIFTILVSILTVIAPIYVGKIIDKFVELSYKEFITNLIILITLYVTIYIFSILQVKFLSKMIAKIQKDIRENLFNKINNIKIKELDKIEYGNVLNQFSIDLENISNGIIQGLPKIITGIVVVIFSIIVMLKINIKMCIILIIVAPVMYFISKWVTKNTNVFFKDRANIVAKLNNNAEEFITYQNTVRDFNYEEVAEKKFENLNTELYKTGVKAQFYSALTNPTTRLISNIGYVVTGIVGVILMSNGEITIGDITTFLMYTSIFTRPFNEITAILSELQTAFASSKRIDEFLNSENEIFEITSKDIIKIRGNIEFKNVEFSYTKEPFIKNFNLKVKTGEKIAIVGKTGAGKTTIVNLLMRFYEIDNGDIYIDGTNIKDIPIKELRDNIGIVLQDTKLFTETVKENIAYGLENISEEEIKRVSKLAKADSFIEKLPKKYNTIINNEMLSEGEIQLITIARVMLRNPSILILDEATSNIDLITENKIQQSMLELMKGKTTFIIAHRLSTIQNADRILYLENGNIVEQGTHEELLSKKGKYFDLYTNQL
ncbi:MAG: ABC transporter ATP-binding protein [Clostridia bacterium]|nr:ABC transporter ATP-binding protein [Clostridia bacterium]